MTVLSPIRRALKMSNNDDIPPDDGIPSVMFPAVFH